MRKGPWHYLQAVRGFADVLVHLPSPAVCRTSVHSHEEVHPEQGKQHQHRAHRFPESTIRLPKMYHFKKSSASTLLAKTLKTFEVLKLWNLYSAASAAAFWKSLSFQQFVVHSIDAETEVLFFLPTERSFYIFLWLYKSTTILALWETSQIIHRICKMVTLKTNSKRKLKPHSYHRLNKKNNV